MEKEGHLKPEGLEEILQNKSRYEQEKNT